MNDQRSLSVSTLLIRQGGLQVVLPGALVAQVMSRFGVIVPVPDVEDWMLGLVAWRSLAVPVISLETLLAGKAPQRIERGRLVVCYPLPGRKASEFFACAAPDGVQTHSVDGAAAMAATPAGLRADLIAGALPLPDGAIGVIPDLNRLSEEFYKSDR
jgi:chemotaxis signal transduction protein